MTDGNTLFTFFKGVLNEEVGDYNNERCFSG